MAAHNLGFFSNEVYTPSSSHPDVIRTGTSDSSDIFDDPNMPDNNIRLITGWVDKDSGDSTDHKGLTDSITRKKAVVAWSIMAVDTIVHEIGHILLLSHYDDDTMIIMHGGKEDAPPGRDPSSNKLTRDQANTFSGL